MSEEERKRHPILGAFIMFVITCIIAYAFIKHLAGTEEAKAKVTDVVTTISGDADSVLQAEVNRLRGEKLDLQKQVETLKTDKRNADALVTKTLKDTESMKQERDAAISAQAQIQEQYNALSEVHDEGPQWEKRFRKANGWHLSFGALASNPVAFNLSDMEFSPTITLLASAGPRRWQVLTGVGYSLEQGMTLSIGFMYTLGDVGMWSVNK